MTKRKPLYVIDIEIVGQTRFPFIEYSMRGKRSVGYQKAYTFGRAFQVVDMILNLYEKSGFKPGQVRVHARPQE